MPPKHMIWNNDCLVIADHILSLLRFSIPIYVFNYTLLRLPTRGLCVLLPEVDGVRILTNTTCEFLNRVNSEFQLLERYGM